MELIAWQRSYHLEFPQDDDVSLRFECARAALDAKDPGTAVQILSDLPATDAQAERAVLLGIAAVHEERWDDARKSFSSVAPNGPLGQTAGDMLNGLSLVRAIPRKSRSIAIAAGIIPGAGYAYSGFPQTAISAMIVNSVFALATAEAFRKDQRTLGWILGVFTGAWYSGSIYGSGLTADRFNEREMDRFRRDFPY